MKSTLVIACMLALISVIPAKIAFGGEKMLFWYPGEAGSTAEAQSVIDDLFSYLEEKNDALDFTGAYFNTVKGGLSYLNNKKPAVGIISYSVWIMQRHALSKAKVLLATLPLPHGASREQYVIVGTQPFNGELPLYMSEPLSRAFIRAKLFPTLPEKLTLTPTKSIVRKLKELAEGKASGYALLTPIEAYTLDKLSSPWAKKLSVLTRSTPVPTARVILIDPSYKNVDLFKKVLLDMKSDPEGTEVLETLRLTGFSTP